MLLAGLLLHGIGWLLKSNNAKLPAAVLLTGSALLVLGLLLHLMARFGGRHRRQPMN